MKVLEQTEKTIYGSPHLRRHRALNMLGSKLDSDQETTLIIERDGKEQSLTAANSINGKSMFFNPSSRCKFGRDYDEYYRPLHFSDYRWRANSRL